MRYKRNRSYETTLLLALSTLPFHLSHAAQPPLELTIQKSSAQSAHLTTRIQWVDFPNPNIKIAI